MRRVFLRKAFRSPAARPGRALIRRKDLLPYEGHGAASILRFNPRGWQTQQAIPSNNKLAGSGTEETKAAEENCPVPSSVTVPHHWTSEQSGWRCHSEWRWTHSGEHAGKYLHP